MRHLTLQEFAKRAVAEQKRFPNECLLVGISGIDGAGKGYVTKQVLKQLKPGGLSVVSMNVDGWLNLPHIRFNSQDPAQHFYHHAIRFEEMFSQLILPLRRNRSVDIVADFAKETAMQFTKRRYHYTNIDIVLLEGIYLFKKAFRNYFDLTVWIHCSFETALERAVRRSQERLSAADTVRAYERIYFPAQKIHFELDQPRENSDFIIQND